MNIIIIGGGQLGSRHLQALQKLEGNNEIYVIDPAEASLNICSERFFQIPSEGNHKLNLHKSLGELGPTSFDFAVIATSSNIRFSITKELLLKFKVKHLLLEKILFQKENEYQELNEILSSVPTVTHVNCCMRMQGTYGALKSSFKNEIVDYRVSGSQFGLMSNSIHYIDHLSFITGDSDFTVNTSHLERSLVESKRKGFFELFGKLQFSFSKGHQLTLDCHKYGSSPLLIEIFSVNRRYIIREAEDVFWYSSVENNWKWEEHRLNLLFQSSLTNVYIDNLSKEGRCDLPSISESSKIHLQFLKAIEAHTKKFCSGPDYFPFT